MLKVSQYLFRVWIRFLQLCLEWEGLDTLVVSAGVSALKPLLEVAGLESTRVRGLPEEFDPPQADTESIQKVVDVTAAATRGNFVGPLIAAVTFVSPGLQNHASCILTK